MSQAESTAERPAPKSNQFGTFGGVFTPSILTILGVIMFMRTGFIVGEAGVINAIIILLLSKFITTLTGLSMSAISTNTNVEGGGAYFLISRSLGPSFGGAIGLTLYLAQALSVPFYVLGFVEALTRTFDPLAPYFMYIGFATATLLFIVTYIGASWAIKMQYFILATLVCAVITFMGGSLLEFSFAQLDANVQPAYNETADFWGAFAIFFPAVTGIMAGVNMSGDLEDPARSIPRGTLYAIAVGALIYGLQMIVVAGSQTRQQLIFQPYESLMESALFGMAFFVVAGVCAATLSSALGSMMGAPRILQALSRDEIFRPLSPFARGSVEGDEPRPAIILTFLLTTGVVFMSGNEGGGDAFNLVAEVLSMFFLYAYGMTNLAAFTESVSGNPSFRPTFKYFNWITALLGTIGCVGVTFLISPGASIFAVVTIAVIFVYVRRRVLSTSFGDARRGFFFSRVRDNLFSLAELEPHPKNWRPTTLVLTGNPRTRETLARYAIWMESGRGLVTLAEVLVGDFHEQAEERHEALERLDNYIEERNLNAFGEVMVAENFDSGMASLIQGHSIGPLKPNMVMVGWSSDRSRAVPMVQHLRLAAELDMSQVILVDRGLPDTDAKMRIDVWWRGDQNGSLMMILAYLLTLNLEWSQVTLRILRLIADESERDEARGEILELIEAARVEADIRVVLGDSITEVVHAESHDASVVILGFNIVPDSEAQAFHDRYTELCEGLPTTLLVCSSGDADLMA